jgi:CelD/BcsL family acetyltransferase involved in cellulose biosynthesis
LLTQLEDFVQDHSTSILLPRSVCENELVNDGTFGVRVVEGAQLTLEDLSVWNALQQSNPELASPCFAPEFVQAVASAGKKVEVAFLKNGNEVVAILPFQRKSHKWAVPAGGIVSDFQGLICRPGFSCEPQELLKASGLVTWDFDRLLASQKCFLPYHKLCEPSARIDLSNGYDAYVAERRAAGTHQIRHCEYMARRIERELGPLRFVRHSTKPEDLAQVLAWKSQQYRRSGWKDIFATAWGRRLVERIHQLQTTGFAGILSLLYAGKQLVAGHLGMRSTTIWHYWFPAYDRRFARYSPGLILLLKMAQCAEELGLSAIDIGTGVSLYKKRLMNTSVSVAEGSVQRLSLLSFFRLLRRKTRSLFRT